MTLNRDLFGDLIPEKPTETPVSVRPREFIRVFHNGWKQEPPHTVEHDNADVFARREQLDPKSTSNMHGDIIHAGSPEAADERGGKYTHVYDVPKHALNEVVFQDADLPSESEDPGPPQSGLWERTPIYPRDVLKQNKVVSYRNAFEDSGGISYMIPKNLIKNNVIKYVGTYNAGDLTRRVQK